MYAEKEGLDLESGSDSTSNVLSGSRPSPPSSRRESSLVDEPANDKVEAEFDSDQDSQDSTTLPSRPNKFRGPPSTWRNKNASERELAASLDTLQAKDLSIHLYNTFKLRQRNRGHEPDRHDKPLQDFGPANEESKWKHPKSWTAWPLPPASVPREHDEMHWKEVTDLREPRHSSPKKPSQHLREMLVAQVLRKAKERFSDRQLETSTETQGPNARGSKAGHSREPSAEHHDRAHAQRPVVMADDVRASKILRPTVQHMITKLDDLLMGLHHARSSYLLVEDSSGEETLNQERERSRSRGRPRKRKREVSKSSESTETGHDAPTHRRSNSEGDISTSEHSESQTKMQKARSSSRKSRRRDFCRRKKRLGLRGWDDVVAIASMTGWRQSVVGKATTRCASIFEEGIKFRVLEEGKIMQTEQLYLPNASSSVSGRHSQSETWRESDDHSENLSDAMVGAVHVDGFLKPIEGRKSWKYGNNKQSKRRLSSRRSKGEA